ncbi:hypothetical protein ACIQ8G_34790 [Streptomyces sp. NPDC094154]|uniref:hypothetical protein n=1 Tax=Streptomyces sp. NPDC094154 TaxID=3366059 RepID=UPI00382479AD
MAGSNGRRAVPSPENLPDSAALKQAATATGDTGTVRLTMAHVLPLVLFPAIGTILFVVGMPVSDIPIFLGYCAGIGAAATIAVTGGRRALIALAHGIIAATGTK